MNFNQYMTFSDVKKRKFVNKYDPGILFFLKDIITVCGKKMKKNRLIKKNQLIKKNCRFI